MKRHLSRDKRPALMGLAWALMACGALRAGAAEEAGLSAWSEIPSIRMRGGLKAFWNIGGKDSELQEREACGRGFEPVTLLNTYSDYPGKQRERIRPDGQNPWNKPPFFERVIRRNIDASKGRGIFVHDIEFEFEESTEALWTNPVVRAASRAATREAFRADVYREWATWFTQPCLWAKEKYPELPVGLYGPQPFRRDYWGVSGKDARQIDGTHQTDAELWRHIAPAVDFCIASVYCFYDSPGSVYYMGANVEENAQRMAPSGGKPVYAYLWLRYHDSNAKLKGQEVADYLAEAMAVLPYFCGARGTVLWGWEPKGQGPYYRALPLFVRSLGRVAALSETLSRATPDNEEPVHAAWKEKRALVRKLRAGPSEWLVLVCNPWQAEAAESAVEVRCGPASVSLAVRGRHTEIYRIAGGRAERVEMAPGGAGPRP